MRCACKSCGTYMIHAEDSELGCICPECKKRCTDCLGTNSVISRENLSGLQNLKWLQDDLFAEFRADGSDTADDDEYSD